MRTLALAALLATTACADAPVVDDKPRGDDPADTGDTADSAEPVSNAGEYVGTVEGLYSWGGGQTSDCPGDASLTLAEDKSFTGTATCTSTMWGTLDGPLEGSVETGVVTGSWTVYFQPDTVPQELTGTVADGTFRVTTDYTNDYGSFSSTIVLTRQ